MRILMNTALVAFLLHTGAAQAQSQADMAWRMHGAVGWCHTWVRQGDVTSAEPEMAEMGFVAQSGDTYGWDGGRPGDEVFRVEFWDVGGDRSCHLSMEPGTWDAADLGRDLALWVAEQDGYTRIPAEPSNPNGTMSHFRDGDRDFVIVTSPDGVGLAGYVMVVSLWTNMSPSQ